MAIPKTILKALGLKGEAFFLAETTPDGAILLRPAGVYPLEIYSEERIREFIEADIPTAEEVVQVRKKLQNAPLP